MKIKSIRLHPFAGLQNETLEFSDGLNLILGPNEAGKSTIFKAIQHGLLTTTSLTKSKLESEMGDLFPLSGGDVIRITIELYLDNPDECYTIKKEWKPGNRTGSASLITPEGNEFTDQEKIQQMIEQLLPVKPGTMKEILLSKQSSLHTSLSRVKDSDQIRQEIGGILRKSVMEAGGVSVDQFKQTLDQQFENHFDNWDRDKNYPQTDASGNDRGIHNPHKRNVGIVLQAWYKKEKENKKLEHIQQYEEEVDALNRKRETVNQQLQEKKNIVEELKPKLEQQTERAILVTKKETVESKLDEVSQIAEKWPVYEYQLKESEPKLKTLECTLDKLSDEQEKASKKSELTTLKQRIDKLEELDKNVEELKEDLEETKKVTEEDVEQLRTLKQDILQKTTTLEASKLSVMITALTQVAITYSGAEGLSNEVELRTGDEKAIKEKGIFSLKTNQINLEVIAGEEELSGIAEQLRVLHNKQEDILKSFEAADLSEVISFKKLYQDKVNRLESLQEQWKDNLGDDSLEELKQKLRKAGDLSNVRALDVIQRERDEVLEEKSTLKSDFNKKRTDISTWSE
ncbi:MAG: AAA family ATPase, partial [Gracilimonas sp.]|nr:AAA family ATPase [Gracilimonas sp.]